MLSSEAFDRWSVSYDEDVRACVLADEYPFAGYFDALDQLTELVDSREGASVLDLGFGTAVLTRRLWENGHPVSGVDFSAEMLARAQERLPGAGLVQYDLTRGLPPELAAEQYDFVLASYSLHHLTDGEKQTLLRGLRKNLKPGGAILIADVCFPTRKAMEACREAYGEAWDDEECYFVTDELEAALPEYHIDVIPASFCADVLILSPEEE